MVNINKILAEAHIHIACVKETDYHLLYPSGIVYCRFNVGLSVDEIDEYTKRWLKTFYPKEWKEVFE